MDKAIPMQNVEELLLYNGSISKTKQRGVWSFIGHKPLIFVSILAGLAGVAFTVGFTYWFATQNFSCPPWAIDCQVQPNVARIIKYLSVIQGIFGTVHGISLGAIAYPAFILAEAELWPILSQKSLTLASMDKYLSAARGSVPSLLKAMISIGGGQTIRVILFVGLAKICMQTDGILVGHAYNRANVTKTYQSIYEGGGGIGLALDQQNPPGPISDPALRALSFYTSWSHNLSSEPLPEVRDFLVDRNTLATPGNLSVSGLNASKAITCTGQPIDIVNDVSSDGTIFTVASSFPTSNNTILLRLQPRLTVWIDNVEHISPVRAVTTLVFASINGTIEGGAATVPTDRMIARRYTSISGLKCTVDVTLEQAMIVIGLGPNNNGVNVSSLETTTGPVNGVSGTLGDVAEWIGGVVTVMGVSVYGAQPMFQYQGPGILPLAFSTTKVDQAPENWKEDDITNFISVASGALAMSMTNEDNTAKTTLSSNFIVSQLIASRSLLLIIPAAAILLVEAFLMGMLSREYRRTKVGHPRQARTSELIQDMHNQSMKRGVMSLQDSSGNRQDAEQLKVRYGVLEEDQSRMGLLWGEDPGHGTNARSHY